ncbi:uncharacterized protein G2W53_027154 [Senna tora]|uniref:Uncharacterized protein n=1 Tax=Senna tora TaxID=362788 RepID=A0A834TQA3_9FABA|nr:uncharacterized protein G2W53_027154 [Senna tora]
MRHPPHKDERATHLRSTIQLRRAPSSVSRGG